MATIKCVKARQIFDSRGNPTVEADVCLSDGTFARASVPSGASTGAYEALELRDGGSDYLGKGVLKAVNNVNSIIGPALIGKDPTEQAQIDNFMVQQLDGTSDEWGWCKRKHIANLAGNKNLVLPVPAFNEFMVLPVGASSFKEALKMGVEVYHHLKIWSKRDLDQISLDLIQASGRDWAILVNPWEMLIGFVLRHPEDVPTGWTVVVVSLGVIAGASHVEGQSCF
ncbi:Enolase [Ananas comosus]|uniref:phosphopyruvate hydratase n=1 Tax=Ananas comosus TaxID=4615 RepID=A0A199UKW8_ANACO|nr:Enolase [Ananas comosus]